jgi:2-dehydro-3-deoxyphosphooctonate aldolase (KDO 8-P synthase)
VATEAAARVIGVGAIEVANDRPFVLFGGMNVLESRELAMQVAEAYVETCAKLGIPYVFKASFDKANRSSITSFRGPGMDEGLKIFQEDQADLRRAGDHRRPRAAPGRAGGGSLRRHPAAGVPVAPDRSRGRDGEDGRGDQHQEGAVPRAARDGPHPAQVRGGGQFAPDAVRARQLSFGYNNLVVDMLGFGIMKRFGYPVIFDVTHALQMPGGRADSAGGRRQQVVELGKAGMSQGMAGLFLEAHPDPDRAKCDGPCALPLDRLGEFLAQMKAMDELVKSLPALEIS